MQHVTPESPALSEQSRPLAEAEGAASTSDTEAVIQQGGQAIEAQGNDLGRAASGDRQDIDLDTARQRMRDCQSALVGLGYHLGDHDDPADGISGTADNGTREAVAQFQDDNDLDISGVIDRDTYESILRAFEQAMSMREHSQLDDDFMPMHAGEAVAQTADTTGVSSDEGLLVDDSEETLLTLRDEMRNGDGAIDPPEDF